MPRFNVQHPVTKQWRCFSTVVDNYVTDWMDEERYQKWREYEYGRHAGPIREANLMSYEKAEEKIYMITLVKRLFCKHNYVYAYTSRVEMHKGFIEMKSKYRCSKCGKVMWK